jgi:hypothetical protein
MGIDFQTASLFMDTANKLFAPMFATGRGDRDGGTRRRARLYPAPHATTFIALLGS